VADLLAEERNEEPARPAFDLDDLILGIEALETSNDAADHAVPTPGLRCPPTMPSPRRLPKSLLATERQR
jgi:hypothetical protein